MVNGRHEMLPSVAACHSCHTGLQNFNYQGIQTEVKGLVDELKKLLEDRGMLRDDLPEPGTYPGAQAGAL
jgi:hypothetical protein